MTMGFSTNYGGLNPATVFQAQSQFQAVAGPSPLAPQFDLGTMAMALMMEMSQALNQLCQGYANYASSAAAAMPASGNWNSAASPAVTMTPSANLPTGDSERINEFIKIAEAQEGKPYVFGATGPNAFDCSGLVYYALNHAGVKVPRLTADGYMAKYKDNAVDKNNLKPGDLIFYHSENDRGIPEGHATHIEIYIGNGKTVGADGTKIGIVERPINWKKFIGAERVPGLYA